MDSLLRIARIPSGCLAIACVDSVDIALTFVVGFVPTFAARGGQENQRRILLFSPVPRVVFSATHNNRGCFVGIPAVTGWKAPCYFRDLQVVVGQFVIVGGSTKLVTLPSKGLV